MKKLSVVLPAHNEEKNIRNAVEKTREKLKELKVDYEIIIAEDGSRDRTYEIALELSEIYDEVRVLHSDERLGRGRALERAFRASQGEILLYMDADLATDLSHISDVLRLMEEGYDIVVGSRKSPLARRTFLRRTLSFFYNLWVRMILKSKVRDHQCGFKAFRREKILKILDEVRDNGWFWDTEVLVRAQRNGLKIAEIPVSWVEKEGTKVRFLRDSLEMGLSALLLRIELMKMEGRWGAGAILTAILLLAALVFFSGFQDILNSIMRMSLLSIATASLLYLLSWFFRSLRYSLILRRMGHEISLGTSANLIFLSQSLNIVLPGRLGDLSRVYLLRRDQDVSVVSSLSSLISERLFDLLSISLLGLLSVILLDLSLAGLNSIPLIISVLVIFLVILLFILQFSGTSRISVHLQKLFEETRETFRISAIFPILIFSILLWLVEASVCYALILPLFRAPFLLVLLSISIGNLIKAFPLTPGGIGTYEAGVTAILSSGGVPVEISFTVALVDHALKNLITLFFGALSLKHFGISISSLKEGVRSVESR
ncbi:MAG: flippase-like domain-containing protein [Archaeoglobi archaeon]|nr:flippase-like domain-containing protein [Candidatus Mnemosynella bozhongmuii]